MHYYDDLAVLRCKALFTDVLGLKMWVVFIGE